MAQPPLGMQRPAIWHEHAGRPRAVRSPARRRAGRCAAPRTKVPHRAALNIAALHRAVSHSKTPRRGLATLEFVLWLPILLMVAALMVNLGTMTVWRMRGEIVARDIAWRARYPRTGVDEPRPASAVWPTEAQLSLAGDDPFDVIDVPELQHPVVRGPLPNGFIVQPLLDPARGAYRGYAELDRDYPVLRSLGTYHSGAIFHSMLDRKGEALDMGLPANVTRRTKYLYQLPQTDPAYPQAYVDSVWDLLTIPHYDDLRVLDRDEEVREYTGSYVDFHPRVHRMCELDCAEVQRAQVVRLIDRLDMRGNVVLGDISRLPRSMTSFFLNMYRQRVAELERQIEQWEMEQMTIPQQISMLQQLANSLRSQIANLRAQLAAAPPGSSEAQSLQSQIDALEMQLAAIPGQIAALQAQLDAIPGLIANAQAEIAELEPKIEQLEQFLMRLPELERLLGPLPYTHLCGD